MKIEIRRSRRRRRQYFVRVVGDNGEKLLHSENYNDIRDARHLVALLIEQASDAPVEDFT